MAGTQLERTIQRGNQHPSNCENAAVKTKTHPMEYKEKMGEREMESDDEMGRRDSARRRRAGAQKVETTARSGSESM